MHSKRRPEFCDPGQADAKVARLPEHWRKWLPSQTVTASACMPSMGTTVEALPATTAGSAVRIAARKLARGPHHWRRRGQKGCQTGTKCRRERVHQVAQLIYRQVLDRADDSRSLGSRHERKNQAHWEAKFEKWLQIGTHAQLSRRSRRSTEPTPKVHGDRFTQRAVHGAFSAEVASCTA